MTVVKVKKLHPDAKLPKFQTEGSAGADVVSIEDVDIQPGDIKAISLGFAVSIPLGYEIQLRPRSGLALKYGISVPNSPGTIDSDFRGEMKAILINHGKDNFKVCKGDRIAQIILNKIPTCAYVQVEELDKTGRNTGGYGSTGIK